MILSRGTLSSTTLPNQVHQSASGLVRVIWASELALKTWFSDLGYRRNCNHYEYSVSCR